MPRDVRRSSDEVIVAPASDTSPPTRTGGLQDDASEARLVTVRGVVQGVGFRPFVYRLARKHGLAGWVLNHSGGVDIEVEGPSTSVAHFLRDLERDPPPLARISGIEIHDCPPHGHSTFEIRKSRDESGRYQLISPDIATCSDCLRELLDPGDRRYRYPFTNCTNCGPRFTIIADVPYDRPSTTMGQFEMCPQCQAEYDNLLDRRFHAQPNACPVCGPRVWLRYGPGAPSHLEPKQAQNCGESDPIARTATLLRRGAIVALKGLGGFHLACDATNADAVGRLRERKDRPRKPLAVMMATLEDVREHCAVSEADQKLLASRECPVVLLPWRSESDVVPDVAPGHHYLGVMLPYTPLHHLLLRDVGRPLVMTSGNRSEEPICQTNQEALERLAHIADAFLLHDRDIYARYDDSVWTVFHTSSPGSPGSEDSSPRGPGTTFPQPLRRSRGYAPYPVALPLDTKPTLAVGAELKNTFCLTRDRFGFLSQHIGDMENLETLEHFEASIKLLQHLFRVEPRCIACDSHPDYLATRYATEQASKADLSLVTVQHHHAHIAACLADNGWLPDDGPVIGVAWDGTGYGADGRIWGGEWLVADYRRYQRLAHLEYLPLPGGEAAIRNPYRIAVGYLAALGITASSSPLLDSVPDAELTLLRQQVQRGLNAPLTSSAGRLFDAVSALLGICDRCTYEAEAAIRLEQISDWATQADTYPWHADRTDDQWIVRLAPLLQALLQELHRGEVLSTIGGRFHRTMATVVVEISRRIRQDTGLSAVALSGGCFQNRMLFGQAVDQLRKAGFNVLVHRQVPTNDGGISLGQAVVANASQVS